MPFARYDMVQGRPEDFLPVTPDQRRRMLTWLDNEHFRSVIVCPREVIAVDCSTSIGMKWGIRLVDGYLNSVSRRYLSLPWPDESRGGRVIRLLRPPEQARNPAEGRDAWRLLSLLNVRTALVVSPELFVNRRQVAPDGVTAIRNPSPYVYPRVFFASRITAVTAAEAREAIASHFGPCASPGCLPMLTEKHPVDYVEGPAGDDLDAGGDVRATFGNDEIVVAFARSSRPRFLVLNEAYDARWAATVDGRPTPTYPTNVVMRGIPVPPGAGEIRLRYRSLLTDTWHYLRIAGPLVLITMVVLRRALPRLARSRS
jgi:hypothetical protein